MSSATAAFDSVHVPTIDSFKRTRIERRRLWRKLGAVSVAPTPIEVQRFGKLKKAILGAQDDARGSNYFSMNAVTLTSENLHLLQPNGFFTPKADGLGGLAAWVTTSKTETASERRHTMLFVTRDGTLRALQNVPLHDDKAAVIDAEMCLCRKKLNADEFWRVTNGFNVHTQDYLDYYTFLDAQAIALHGAHYDITGDEHQAQYDDLYEMCCAAFDCLLYGTKCAALTYRERIAVLNDALDTVFVQLTVPRKKRLEAIQRSLEQIGGADKIPVRLFLKPVVPMHCIHSGFHALPPVLYGVRVDGVVLMRSDQMYTVGFAPEVLKWKPSHAQTVDFTIVACETDDGEVEYRGCITGSGASLLVVTTHILEDTDVAQSLLSSYSCSQRVLNLRQTEERVYVLECQPVIAGGGGADAPGTSAKAALQRRLWWRPIEWREEKTFPNARANYEGVCKALLNAISENEIIAAVRAAGTTSTVVAPASTNTPMDAE